MYHNAFSTILKEKNAKQSNRGNKMQKQDERIKNIMVTGIQQIGK